MDDLISRQAAIKLIQKYHGKMPNEINHQMWKEANDLPSAQPEQKKGKWIDNTYCSECGWVHETDAGFIGFVDGFNFCPQCGSDMRGEQP